MTGVSNGTIATAWWEDRGQPWPRARSSFPPISNESKNLGGPLAHVHILVVHRGHERADNGWSSGDQCALQARLPRPKGQMRQAPTPVREQLDARLDRPGPRADQVDRPDEIRLIASMR